VTEKRGKVGRVGFDKVAGKDAKMISCEKYDKR